MSVNNQTTDAIQLPLFKNFLALGNDSNSYEPDPFGSQWPDTFPAGSTTSGSVDLKDPVNANISTMSISFSTIYGSLKIGGTSLTVPGISIP
jgi:hypothetical protein